MDDTTQVGRAWRVGVLFSETGVTAAVERTQLQATLLAIDEINAAGGVLDLPLEPVRYDPESNPKRFRVLAEQLLGVDRVRLVFGCYMSSSRKAVLPVIEAHRALLFYPTLYEGFEYSRHCIYTGAAPNQNSLQLARFLFEHYGNRFLLVGSNYVYPYESNRVMTDLVRQNHGKIVNEIYVPLNAREADFSRTIQEIKKTSPDVIFSTVVGTGTAAFYQAYRAAGFDPARQPIASLTTSEAEVAEMAAETAEGHITAAPFFETLGTPVRAPLRDRLQTAIRGRRTDTRGSRGRLLPSPSRRRGDRARRQCRPRTRAAGALRDRVRGAAGARADRSREQPHLSLASGRAPRRPA